jgi:DNA-binding transcriptional LysR family regulator
VVPQSLRRFRERQPDAELQLTPATNLEQIEGFRSRRLCVQYAENHTELDHIPVALQHVELAVPKGHPLVKLKKLRLRDLAEASFMWFPRREAPAVLRPADA